MQCIEYKSAKNITVQFLDEYKYTTTSAWKEFKNGAIINPYFKSVYGVGMLGTKYKTKYNNITCKEYDMWNKLLQRCYDDKFKEKYPTYKNAICCDEWLLYENFYEWLHSQENFNKWEDKNNKIVIDKSILLKNNNIYSPKTCCLVPVNVSRLFLKHCKEKRTLPIGVSYDERSGRYCATISMITNKRHYRRKQGRYPTPEDAFYLGYKPYKEYYIQKIAQEEYDKGNITKHCYEAMMNYEVEITD